MNSKKILKIKQNTNFEEIIIDNKSKSHIKKNYTIGHIKKIKRILEQIASIENLKLAWNAIKIIQVT